MADSYYLQSPQNQQYYRYLATFASFTAIGHQTWWGFEPPAFKKIFFVNNICVYVFAPVLFASQLAYLVKNYSDMSFNVRGIMFAILPVNGLVNLIVISANQDSFKKVMKDFMGKIHLCNLEHQDEYVSMIRLKAEKLTRFASYFIVGFLMIDWLAWCSITGLNNYHYRELIHNKTKRLETVIYTTLPFDYEYNYKNWLIVHTVNTYLVWSGCAIISIHNITNYSFTFQLIGHIEILKHKIETEFQDLTQDEVRNKLIDVIKYHAFVLNIFRDIQEGFGFNVTAYYFYNLLADSLNMYQLMVGDKRNAMVYGLMVLVYGGGLIMISFVLEEVRRESDGLADVVYNIDWESMSTDNRKIYLLLLMRIQPALVFTACGGLKAGVRPMISIVRTSFSIYVMLKSDMKT